MGSMPKGSDPYNREDEVIADLKLAQDILVLGVGNLLRQDEGVGVRVIKELVANYYLPETVTVVDGGTAGFRLLPLLMDARRLIIVDALDVGAPPGTVIECTPEDLESPVLSASLHEAGPMELLVELEAATGQSIPTVIVGVQPANLSPWNDTLSEPVAAAVSEAVARVITVLSRCGVVVVRRCAMLEVPRSSVG